MNSTTLPANEHVNDSDNGGAADAIFHGVFLAREMSLLAAACIGPGRDTNVYKKTAGMEGVIDTYVDISFHIHVYMKV